MHFLILQLCLITFPVSLFLWKKEEKVNNNYVMIWFQVNTLALKGGVDICECVWRIMHAMITNSLARTINMRGINGKIGFQRLQLTNVVIGKLALIPVVSYLCLIKETERIFLRYTKYWLIQKKSCLIINYGLLLMCGGDCGGEEGLSLTVVFTNCTEQTYRLYF